MSTQKEKAERFRTLHKGPSAFVIPNPWDVGSARILAGLGFQRWLHRARRLPRRLGAEITR